MAKMSNGRAIGWLAEQDPDAVLITHEGVSVTRSEFHRRTNRLARAYAALGVKQDDFVTVALPNGVGFYEACVAAWKLGATPQPISAKLPAVERRAIIELAQPSLVVGGDEAGAGAAGSTADTARVSVIGADFVPDPQLSDSDLEDRVAASMKAPTSGGSTGRPKIIVSGQRAETDPEATRMALRQLVPGPLYHNAPFLFSMQSLLTGGHLVVMSRFDAEQALQLIEQHRIEFVLMVPTMMQRIWRLGDELRGRHDVSSLTRILHLGAPCPVWLKEAWIGWLGPERVNELYAGTEAQVATVISGSEWLEHRGSVGKVQGGGAIRILDADGKELPAGQVGEVFMMPAGGKGSTYRYIGAEARDREGWESLGDMGHVDEDGYLYLADRQTDMILCGGANIYPAEVEAAIDAHPSVRSSAAIGLPHEDLGNAVHAIVDIGDNELSEAELRAFLGDQLSRPKQPRSYELVREPLRDDAGKMRRSALRKERLALLESSAND